MTEDELRALVREAIAQSGAARQPLPASAPGGLAPPDSRNHPSHGLFVLPAGDGACLIEPAVSCNHCGYCKSYGH